MKKNILTKTIVFLAILLFTACGTTPTVIYKPYVHKISCPELLFLVLEENSVEKTEEENLLILLNNITKINRMIENRMQIIKCYKENYELMKKEVEENE